MGHIYWLIRPTLYKGDDKRHQHTNNQKGHFVCNLKKNILY